MFFSNCSHAVKIVYMYVAMYTQWLSSGLLKAKIVRKGLASSLCNVFRVCSFPTAVYLQKSLWSLLLVGTCELVKGQNE